MKKLMNGLVILTIVGVMSVVGISIARADTQPSIEVYDPSDTAGPTLSSTVVSPTQINQGQSLSITVTAEDVSGVRTAIANIKSSVGAVKAIIQLYDDGKHNDGQSGDGVFASTWNSGTNQDDNYSVDIQLADIFGHPTIGSNAASFVIGAGASNSNTNTTNANTNTSDTTAPVIAITSPNEGADIGTSSIDVYANATDPESTVTKVDFYLDSESAPHDTQNFDQPSGSGDYIWVLNVASLSTGSHVLRAVATNGVGLTASATRTINVTYTSSAPVVTIISPLSGSFNVGTPIDVNVSATDATDITRIELYTSKYGGPLASVDITGSADTNVTTTLHINLAGDIAMGTAQKSDLAVKWPRFRLPFVSVADAATSYNVNGSCTTTTITDDKSIYAMAYNASLSANSGYVTYSVWSSSTSCTNTASSSSSSAS
ncbi:MAG: Ig-like domain-containing protein [Patescibacteria group bacterium]